MVSSIQFKRRSSPGALGVSLLSLSEQTEQKLRAQDRNCYPPLSPSSCFQKDCLEVREDGPGTEWGVGRLTRSVISTLALLSMPTSAPCL